MKVAITAVSGHLGSEIAQELVMEIGAAHVLGTARTLSKAENLGITELPGDYNSRSDFDKALKGVDVVIIVSGMDAPEKRIEQHRNIINAAKAAGVRKVVYSSIIGDDGNGQIFNLAGESISQTQLAAYLNTAFSTSLVYEEMSPEEYLSFQQNVNGEFLGKLIAGIYLKIRQGEFNVQSDFEAAAGRKHLEWKDYFISLKQS